MKYCPNCKTEYQDWATECADCKVPLVDRLPQEEKPEPEEATPGAEEGEEIRFCPHCGAPMPAFDEVCPDCQAHTGPYATFDPIKQIQEQGRIYRKTASGEYDRRKITPYMSIIFSVVIFLLPAIFFLLTSLASLLYGQLFMAALTFIFTVLWGWIGIKIFQAALQKIRGV